MKKIILASKSPRRSQLLELAGIPFEIRTKEIEEIYPDTLAVEEVAPFLAKLKALAMIDTLQDGEVILTADSVVIHEGIIYGKPKDFDDAKATLQKLSGSVHTVITGVCMISKEKEEVFAGVSDVYFDELTDEEIEYYINTYEPYDKAGSYGIQEWVGLCKINKIEGTFPNIMGLPVDLVYKHWQRF
ncbi:MAG: Maf family nucleotide pyrophosphatase [Saprospiraceae bacterium]